MISTVDGKSWASQTIGANISNGYITITGTSSDGTRIDISIKDTKTGTYPVAGIPVNGTTVPNNIVTYVPANSTVSNPLFVSTNLTDTNVGSIIITEIDQTAKTISGTFSSKPKD